MKIKTVVIDSDARTRKLFRQLSEEFVAELEVLGEAESLKEAHQLIEAIRPDLIVIDRKAHKEEQEQLDSFKKDHVFDVVLTAHFHELSELDSRTQSSEIMTKPISVESIKHLARNAGAKYLSIKDTVSDAFLVPDLAKVGNQHSKIAIPVPKGFKIVTLNDILFCSADRVYTDFKLIDGTALSASRSLKYFEELLCSFGFHRVHASFLVNLDHVQEYLKGNSSKGGVLVLKDEHQIPVARGRKNELLDKFSIRLR